jgi:gamma-glutamyltranspeptidase/glutathione hydrolase
MGARAYERVGVHGAVSTTHYLATSTAMGILSRGGNAFDAAVAGGLVLQVVEPHSCGPGGEVPAVFVTARDAVPRVLCGQGVAPAAATIETMQASFGLRSIPGTGLLPATVPGAWGGWLLLLRDHGTMALRDVLEPALGYATGGYPLIPTATRTISVVADHFREHWPTSAATWLSHGRTPAAGSVHRRPALASTWQRLLATAESATSDREGQIEAARQAWYHGFVAEAVDAFCQSAVRDETGEEHIGVLRYEDLSRWEATYEDAATADVGGGWTVCKPGAWSQGPVLLQTLQILRDDRLRYDAGAATAQTVHLAAEAVKLAFADREAWYGDSRAVPLTTLISAEYGAERRRLIDDDASLTMRPGSPDGLLPRLPDDVGASEVTPPAGRAARTGLGEPTVDRDGAVRGDTVHIDVVDAQGNMISATPSGGWLQSSPTIPDLGFCLGTRGQMFWLDDGLPSSLQPGRRPRTTLTPTLALADGEPRLAFGTPGGDQQDQWQL